MIRELNANQVVLVSGGTSFSDLLNTFTASSIGSAIGAAAENRVVQAAGRVALSAVRGAPFGGVGGIIVGAAIGVAIEIAVSTAAGS